MGDNPYPHGWLHRESRTLFKNDKIYDLVSVVNTPRPPIERLYYRGDKKLVGIQVTNRTIVISDGEFNKFKSENSMYFI